MSAMGRAAAATGEGDDVGAEEATGIPAAAAGAAAGRSGISSEMYPSPITARVSPSARMTFSVGDISREAFPDLQNGGERLHTCQSI
jgi:hypothetical protein